MLCRRLCAFETHRTLSDETRIRNKNGCTVENSSDFVQSAWAIMQGNGASALLLSCSQIDEKRAGRFGLVSQVECLHKLLHSGLNFALAHARVMSSTSHAFQHTHSNTPSSSSSSCSSSSSARAAAAFCFFCRSVAAAVGGEQRVQSHLHASACDSIRQHTSACVSMRQHTCGGQKGVQSQL